MLKLFMIIGIITLVSICFGIWFVWFKKIKYKCGHYARKSTKIYFNGKPLGRYADVSRTWCGSCFQKGVITCSNCKGPILPQGEPVIVIHNPTAVPPDAPIYESDEGKFVIICSRMNTTGCGLDLSGHWVMPGKFQPIDFAQFLQKPET